jgi:RpiR family carbohydrate utilization transcriptional regulator
VLDISEWTSVLSPAEKRVADVVLADSEAALSKTLATIAEEAGVSEPTVVRFCRSVGCTGLPAFKMKLAKSLSWGASYVHTTVRQGDDINAIVRKICGASVAAINDLRESLDYKVLQQATAAMLSARRIDCYGVGASAVAALDASQKFLRLGVATQSSLDNHLQTIAAATLQPGDVALVFSHTGQVRDTVRSARVGRERGATVIGITRSNTALAQECNITIAVDPIEDTFVYTPMVARVAHLVIVDILATSVALARGPHISEQFKRIKESLKDQWIENEDIASDEPAEEVA